MDGGLWRARTRRLGLPIACLLGAGLLGACRENGPLMTPGQDCLACHRPGGGARTYTVAGTVYGTFDARADEGLDGVEVVITDSAGRTRTLTANAAGNFYTDERLEFPLRVEARRGASVRRMGPLVDNGSCAACHKLPPTGGAQGRVFVGTHDVPVPVPQPPEPGVTPSP